MGKDCRRGGGRTGAAKRAMERAAAADRDGDSEPRLVQGGGSGQEPVAGRRGATLARSGLRAGGGGRGWRAGEGLAARALAGAGRGMAEERNG